MSDAVKLDPAGRLIDIFEKARRHSTNKTARAVWAEVFNVDSTDTASLIACVAEMIDLTRCAKQRLLALDDIDGTLYTECFDALDRAFACNGIDGPWAPFLKQLNSTTLLGLRFCSDRLRRQAEFGRAKEVSLDSLVKQIQAVHAEAKTANLPTELRLFIFRHLRAIEDAIFFYEIRGAEGLEAELEKGLGGLYLRSADIEVSQNSGSLSLWDKYQALLTMMAQAVSSAKGIKELTAPLQKLLGL